MDTALLGGLVNALRSLAAASPTILIGLFIAALMRFYLGPENTRRLFGGDSIRSLPQSWLMGMLLPVCSIGVIPIMVEMRRIGMRPGAISAFALSAPLFNPLSLLYGLTLSRPYVIVGFAIGSLLVVTVIGLIWDRIARGIQAEPVSSLSVIGSRRLKYCAITACRELVGTTGRLALIAMLGVAALGAILPHGALQTSAEQDDLWAPLRMAALSVPVYATPMQTIGQLGMMFAHGNSPGAAFALLLLGTGLNLGTLWWLVTNYGWRATSVWFSSLFVVVVLAAYLINEPLIPPGVEPAGHTHAFDVYSNPFGGRVTLAAVVGVLAESIGWAERVTIIMLGLVALVGAFLPELNLVSEPGQVKQRSGRGFDRNVPPVIVGITGLVGLVAASIVGCYAYYPSAEESLEEIKIARTETLVAATSQNVPEALRWLEVWEEWSRRLEVGSFLRTFELRPYQQMQAYILRKKLELLEHELEHETLDQAEIGRLIRELSQTSLRLSKAFRAKS